ncbi:MCM domain-containing protein 2-like [Elysia marginata]|uniref:MCM domain-containing protein 2-like n=1 Tax=Elysia marginata TaxID=1093978 RepID=A0AAV4EKB7_9GAST|nr:MCM domain-containing protein 2-like [Elysia marginata]
MILSLATGFAKLCLSSQVQESDAVMAAYLYEESLVSRLGLSVLSIQPQPHVSESFIQEFLGKQNDLSMQKFQVQLLKFCSRVFDSRSSRREE